MGRLLLLVMFILLGHYMGYAQLNGYKYIIVPAKFRDFKNDNQFRTSTLVKYLFVNEGFNAVYSNDLPDDLKDNLCLGVRVELIDESTLFATKTRLSLNDCNGVLVMMSQDGRSKTKEFEQAYREAISESFGSFRGLNYQYEPNDEGKTSEPITVSFKNDVKTLEDEVKTEIDNTAVEPVEKIDDEAPMVKTNPASVSDGENVLYAQAIEGGYQLVNSTPEIVYILKSTSAPDVFIVNKDGKNGVIYKNDSKWFIEMDEKRSKPKELNIKF